MTFPTFEEFESEFLIWGKNKNINWKAVYEFLAKAHQEELAETLRKFHQNEVENEKLRAELSSQETSLRTAIAFIKDPLTAFNDMDVDVIKLLKILEEPTEPFVDTKASPKLEAQK